MIVKQYNKEVKLLKEEVERRFKNNIDYILAKAKVSKRIRAKVQRELNFDYIPKWKMEEQCGRNNGK